MKKITLFFASFLMAAMTYAQCPAGTGGVWPTTPTTSNESGFVQTISTCNYTGEYSVVNGVTPGSTYSFTIELNSDSTPKYATVVNDADLSVIAFGPSPLTGVVMPVGVTSIRINWTDDAACVSETSSCHTTTILCTSCTPPPPPPGDVCTDAQLLTCGGSVMGDTSAAGVTNDLQGDCGSVDNDANNLWYYYDSSVAGVPENVTLSTCNNAAYDTSIAVYTGACGALTCYANNDDAPGCAGFTSEVSFVTDGSSTYYVMVEGFSAGDTGAFTMSMTCSAANPPPANDLCSSAEALTVGAAPAAGDNTDATSDINNPSCDLFGVIDDVWYSFVAPASGAVDINTVIGTALDANVAVYDDCAQTTELGCSAGNAGEAATVNGLTPGNTYYVQVWNGAPGSFTIEVVENTLSAGSFELNGFEYYPNPVTDVLTMNAQDKIDNVEIYNMIGQRVMTMKPDAVQSQVDMTNLSQGTYFVRVTINNVSETIQIVKR
ncbi:MAG: T9SS type A sorting domain-containing protein [Bacteroidia bacterium]|nr:T9SS type A sorting domain-containing protein [Bacteroidia bacterium]